MNYAELLKFSPQIHDMAKKYHIRSLWIFGSVARGCGTPRSDVDFLLEMEEGVSLMNIAGFAYEAEMLLGVRVDVVPTSILPKLTDRNFAESVQKDSIPF